jgi:hypothetical protein
MSQPQPTPRIQDPEPQSFPEDCKQVLHGLRGALTSALGAVGVDPARPQEVARRLGLHRNLTWKVSKIVTGTNVFAAVPHVPGRSGMEILVTALGKAGAPESALADIGDAMAGFDRLVRQHSGDRATLDLVASGFVKDASQREALAQSRRQAFRGNSATWSVQARALMSLKILAPSTRDPGQVDLVQVHGMIDFRRLRPDVSWPLFRRQNWDSGGEMHPLDGAPIGGAVDPSGVPLLREFCSGDLPQLNVIRGERETEYELPAGPVGRLGELSVIYGAAIPSIGPTLASDEDDVCELGCNMQTPVELVHSDLLVHEGLPWAMHPRAQVFSMLEGRAVYGASRRGCSLLDGETELHELGLGIGTMATPHIPRYSELLAHVFDSIGWDESVFRGFRFTLAYPPIPAVAMLSMDLERPE